MNIWYSFIAWLEGVGAWITGALDSVKAALRAFTEAIAGPLQFMVDYSAIIILAAFVLLILFCVFVKKDSLSNLRHIKTLIVCGLFMALNIILSYFTIKAGPYLEIGLGSITLPVLAALYGPLTACLVGLTQDLLKFIINPSGAYLPLLTILAGMGGLVYGIFFYKRKVTFGNALLAKLAVNVFVNMIFYSIALAPIMKSGIVGILPARIIKNVLTWPILAVIIYFLIKTVQRVIPKKFYN